MLHGIFCTIYNYVITHFKIILNNVSPPFFFSKKFGAKLIFPYLCPVPSEGPAVWKTTTAHTGR